MADLTRLERFFDRAETVRRSSGWRIMLAGLAFVAGARLARAWERFSGR